MPQDTAGTKPKGWNTPTASKPASPLALSRGGREIIYTILLRGTLLSDRGEVS